MWVTSIDKAINDALNNIQNKSNSSFNVSSSNELVNSNTEENESNDWNSELFDLNEPSYSSSFNTDVNSPNPNGFNCSQNTSSCNLVNNNNNNSSFKNGAEVKSTTNLALGNKSNFNRKKNNFEIKNNLLSSVSGNQNCCDCGASSPTWVHKIISFFFLLILVATGHLLSHILFVLR